MSSKHMDVLLFSRGDAKSCPKSCRLFHSCKLIALLYCPIFKMVSLKQFSPFSPNNHPFVNDNFPKSTRIYFRSTQMKFLCFIRAQKFFSKVLSVMLFYDVFFGRKKIIGMKSASTKQPGLLEVLALLPTFAALCNDEWWEVLQRFLWWFVDDDFRLFFPGFLSKAGILNRELICP